MWSPDRPHLWGASGWLEFQEQVTKLQAESEVCWHGHVAALPCASLTQL